MRLPGHGTAPDRICNQRTLDFAAIARGAEFYAQYCAACHGTQAEGAPNWQELGPDGKVRPPPLNGTDHDIIIWLQSLWPEEVYQAWYKRDQSFRAKKAND